MSDRHTRRFGLQPEFDFEIGHVNGGDYWVPRVVFTCGAVVARETDVAEPDDELLVYYGAADTAIGVATARIGDLMPLELSQRSG